MKNSDKNSQQILSPCCKAPLIGVKDYSTAGGALGLLKLAFCKKCKTITDGEGKGEKYIHRNDPAPEKKAKAQISDKKINEIAIISHIVEIIKEHNFDTGYIGGTHWVDTPPAFWNKERTQIFDMLHEHEMKIKNSTETQAFVRK